jgi:cytochrome c
MQFDDYGDLWMTIGDNQQTDKGPGNTADFRGGILRIHPDDAAPNGYTIPKGNFAEVFKAKATGDMAAKWADTNVVKPQIYVKGTRNAYTMFVDPVRRWVGWGDVGPDQGNVSEEYNLVKEPVFAGWPYYAGEEDMTGISAYGNAGAIKAGSTKAAPVNGAGLGIKNLPPVTDPIFARNQGCAMVGPIFRYDGTNTYAGQFPPQMNRKWLIGGCDGYGWHLITLNDAGTSFTKNETIWSQMTPKVTTLVDAKQGPDGAVYYVDYGKGTVNKIEYTGTCKDPSMLPEVAPANPNLTRKTPSRAQWLAFDRRSISVSAQGGHQIEILDLHGRVLAALSGTGPQSHAMPLLPAAGLYHLRVRAASGEVFAALPYIGK